MPEDGCIVFQTPDMKGVLISYCDFCIVSVVDEFCKAREMAVGDVLMGRFPE